MSHPEWISSHVKSRFSHHKSRLSHPYSRLSHLESRLSHPESRFSHHESRLSYSLSRLSHPQSLNHSLWRFYYESILSHLEQCCGSDSMNLALFCWIWSVLLFWSLKIHLVVQKLWFFTWNPNFLPKNFNFFHFSKKVPNFEGI